MDTRDATGEGLACATEEAAGGMVQASETRADGEVPTMVELVRDLHEGRIAAASLPAELRRRCVGHLTDEGFSIGEIAAMTRISERTISRDRAAIRTEGAVGPSLRMGDELMGELERITLSAIQRLRRLGGDSKTPAYARLWAVEATVRVYERFVERARAMRYCTDGSEMLNYMLTTDKPRINREDEVRAANRVRDRKVLASVV